MADVEADGERLEVGVAEAVEEAGVEVAEEQREDQRCFNQPLT